MVSLGSEVDAVGVGEGLMCCGYKAESFPRLHVICRETKAWPCEEGLM